MRPLYLTLSGFGPYPGEERVDFTRFGGNGVFLITGPTGSGKTTIFDGITYALFGLTSTQIREKSSLRSDFSENEKETYIELVFQHKDKEYTIRRSPRYERLKKRGTGVTVSNETALLLEEGKRPLETVSEVNSRVEEILGFNYKQFKQLGMLAQGEFMELLLASSRDRVEIFRDLFQTGDYEELSKRLGERARGLRGRLYDLDSRIDEVIGQAGVEKSPDRLPEELVADIGVLYEQTKKEKKEIEEALREEKKQKKALEEKGAEYFKLSKELLKEQEKNKKRQMDWQTQEKKAEETKTLFAGWQEDNKVRRELEKEAFAGLTEEKQKLLFEKKENQGWERQLLQADTALKEKKREKEAVKELLKKLSDFSKASKAQKTRMDSYEKQKEREEKARSLYQEKEELYRSAAIGLAARFLEEGKPCPVCGSLTHPDKARVSEAVPDQKEVDEYKRLAERERELLDAVFAETREALGALKRQEADIKAECEKAGILNEADGQEKYRVLQTEEEACVLSLAEWKKREKEAKGVEKKLEAVEKQLEALKKKEEKSREKEEKESLKLRERLSKEEIKAASLKTVFEEGAKAEGVLQEKLENAVKKLSLDITLLEAEIKAADQLIRELEGKRDAAVTGIGQLKTAWDTLKTRLAERKELEKEYGIWQDLDNVTKGRNKDRLVFEQYVLAVYFEEVLKAANVRLSEMTNGRFELRKIRRVEDARTTNSLDIEIFDHYTGKCRSVKSLSGGESFKAALCLALGMADMIEASIGGIRIDTLFIDEGFGSLDEESLDQALKSLLSLTGQKHFIGIISHVNELKERIDQQIVIEKGRSGSRICAG